MNNNQNQGGARIIVVFSAIVIAILIYMIATGNIGQSPPAQPQATSEYQLPPANSEKGGPEEDPIDYFKTNVPEGIRDQVLLTAVFPNVDDANGYFDRMVYAKAKTKVEIASIYRFRAATSYAALTWPDNLLTDLIGLGNQTVLKGSELSTVTIGDGFLIIGTDQAQVLNGINFSEIQVTDNTVTVTSYVEPKGLAIGFAIAPEENSPQIEHAPIITPNAKLDAWLLIRERLPSESELNNLGLKTASKGSIWLMLHKDAPELWADIVASIETPGEDHAYNLLAPFLQQAFCSKLDSYQQEQIAQGKDLELLACNDQVEIVVVLKAVMPTNANGQTGLEFMKMLESGYFVQTPDSSFSVDQ
jgi:hypothetical protein